MHEFQILEDAVISALEPLKTSLGLRTIEADPEQVLGRENLSQYAPRFPAVFVGADQMTLSLRNRYDEARVKVSLVVGDRNVRGTARAARGDSQGPGAYGVLEAVRGLLHRKKISPGWGELYLKQEIKIALDPKSGVCLFGANYETKRAWPA